MKKWILFLIVVFMYVPFVNAKDIYVNKFGIKMTNEEIGNLKELGFSEDEIATMQLDDFNYNKNIEAKLVSVDTKYIKTVYMYSPKNNKYAMNNSLLNEQFKSNPDDFELTKVLNFEITEDEYNKDDENDFKLNIPYDNNPHTYETNSKKLTTTISYLSSTKRYRLKNELKWKNSPKVRSNDLFGIATSAPTEVPVSGSQHASGTWNDDDSCRGVSNQGSATYNKKWYLTDEGYAIFFGIPEDYYETVVWDTQYGNTPYPCNDGAMVPKKGSASKKHSITNMIFTLYFDVQKRNQGTDVEAYGSYQHTVKTLGIDTNFGLSISPKGELGNAFNVSASYKSYFDGMGGTHAQILNPQW